LALAKRHCWFLPFGFKAKHASRALHGALRNKKPGAVSRPGFCVILDRALLIGDSRYVVNHTSATAESRRALPLGNEDIAALFSPLAGEDISMSAKEV
jgi:hypothetical protein